MNGSQKPDDQEQREKFYHNENPSSASTEQDNGEKRQDISRHTSAAIEQKRTPSEIERGERSEPPEERPQDPNLVTWEGPDDMANPKNWSFKRRWAATALVSLITFMTPIASSMIAPAETTIDKDLGVKSTIESELIFSIFLLAFIIGPLFLAPLCELYGRVIVLQLANIFFLIFNLVCGFAQNPAEILAFRFLAGLGACAPQTIGGGVLSDLWTSDERGRAVALYTLAPILGPSVGPIIGAWVSQKSTWRWSFWAVSIFGVAVQILIYFTLPETYAPRILQLKALKLRKETGNEELHTAWETGDRRLHAVLRHASMRVFVMLGTQPIVQFLALFMALIYGIIYLMLATFPLVWTDIYHESIGIGGLNYISIAIGTTIGAQTGGRLLDLFYRRLKARSPTGAGRPEFRVPLTVLATLFLCGGLLLYGWTAQYHVHWIAPNIGAAMFGIGAIATMTSLQSYAIDCYQVYAASAIGATAVARSMTGFSFPLFADYMFEALGQGWGNTILALSSLVVGLSGCGVLWFYGERLRKASQFAAENP